MTISFSSKISEKPVAKKHNAVECDNCKLWVHIKCNKIIKEIFNLLMEDNAACCCMKCTKSIFPFKDFDKNNFILLYRAKK